MIPATQQTIVERLANLCELSPDIRFGQLMANLGFLSEDLVNQSLWDIEDEQLLAVIEKLRTDLLRRQDGIAQPVAPTESASAVGQQSAIPVLNS